MKIKKIFSFFFLVFFVQTHCFSQCAMCKAVVEANLKEGGSAGAGLNDGILYLMVMPYLAMLFFAIFYYLQKNKKQDDDTGSRKGRKKIK